MDCNWAILLLTGAWLYGLVSCEKKNLCHQSSGVITDDGTEDDEYDFISNDCNSNPNALVLKFKPKKDDCKDFEILGFGCTAKSIIKASGKTLFDTCEMQPIACYVISTADIPFSSFSDLGCPSNLVYVVKTMPTITFEYKMCKSSARFTLTYSHVVKTPEQLPSTTTTQTAVKSTLVLTTAAPTTTPATSTVTLTRILTNTTFHFDSDVTTNRDFKSKQTTWASTMSSRPEPQGNSVEKILAIILGVLLIISLLVIGILAIRYHRVVALRKPSLPTNSQSADASHNNGEVVVNQIYESVQDKKTGGEMVVNELYGMT